MRRYGVVVVIACSYACVKSTGVQCADGRTCPSFTVCDDTRTLCITHAQTTACAAIADGSPCDADGTPGICDRGLCEPGCGDGVTDPNEQCDDGNFASHDGCSSVCQAEVPSWASLPKQWTGTLEPAAAYSDALGRIVLFGGQTSNGVTGRIWQRDPSTTLTASAGWYEVTDEFSGPQPPPRDRAMMTYDSARGTIVLFGGADAAGNLLGDTWEYGLPTKMTASGEIVGTWTQTTPAGSPTPRREGTMAFDAAMGKTVLVGGTDAAGLQADTWTYDGTWTQLSPATAPLASQQQVLAYNPTRQRLVLFALSGTWEFDGSTWTYVTPSVQPTTRTHAAMAYDASLDKLVLFGGQDPLGTTLSDTWTYDTAWQQLSFPRAPGEREGGVLVPDPVNHVLALVGGVSGSGATIDDVWELAISLTSPTWVPGQPSFEPAPAGWSSGAYDTSDHALYVYGGLSIDQQLQKDVWRFDGQRWVQLADGPRARAHHVMGYDPVRNRIVVFGGSCPVSRGGVDCGHYAPSARTLELDPVTSTWTDTDVDYGPMLGRSDASMAYDAVDHYLVLFGGLGSATDLPSDTWTYDGVTWTQLASSSSGPAGTLRPAMGWDAGIEAVVLFDSGGVTWKLQHGGWSQLIGASQGGPIGRFGAGFSYDVQRKRFVLAGGQGAGGERLDDVWELDAAAGTWSQLFVSGDSPLPRQFDVFAPFSNAREHVLLGGFAGSQVPLGDEWTLQYRSATPDELCGDGVDNDGDRQVDAADPDCTAL